MIETKEGIVTITCDKCNKTETSNEANYNQVFWDKGFVLNAGRKYEHLCYECLPKKKQKAMTFVKNKLRF